MNFMFLFGVGAGYLLFTEKGREIALEASETVDSYAKKAFDKIKLEKSHAPDD